MTEPIWGGPNCEVDGCPNPAPNYYTCDEHTEADNDYWDAVDE